MMSTASVNDLLWNQFLQSTLLALAVALLVRVFGKKSPHLAHALWGLVLLKCITPPIIASPTGVFSWFGSVPPAAYARLAANENRVRLLKNAEVDRKQPSATQNRSLPKSKASHSRVASSWRQTVGTLAYHLWSPTRRFPLKEIWLLGSVLLAIGFACRLGGFLMHIQSHSRGRSNELLQLNRRLERRAGQLARRLGINGRVRVRVLDVLVGPAIIGLFRPCVVLPRVIVQAVSPQEIDALLAHEMVHFRRGDLWWSLVQACSLIACWCNPVIWFVSKKLSHETELCCDEETIASLGIDSAAYANCLIAVLEQKHSLKAAPMLPGVRPIEVTSKRLEKIMRLGHGSHKRCPSWVKMMFLLGAAVALPGLPLAVGQNGPLVEKAATIQAGEGEPVDAAGGEAVRRAIRYEIQIVELPAKPFNKQLESWQRIDGSMDVSPSGSGKASGDESKVVPAGFTAATKSASARKSEPLGQQVIQRILRDATVLCCPKVIAYEGRSADLFTGQEMPFVTSCEMIKDEDGKETGTAQPIVTIAQLGVSLSLNGQLNEEGDSVQLQFEFDSTELERVDEFTFETAGGPQTVQQPRISSNRIETTLTLPVGTTVAVSGGPTTRVVTKQTSVPVLKNVPYVNRLFKNVSATRVDVTQLVLIRCEVVDEANMPAPKDREWEPNPKIIPAAEPGEWLPIPLPAPAR